MQEMVERYLAAWNEKDASRRRKLVDELWAEDGSYTDPLGDANGPAEIDGLIGAVQQQFPDFVFTLGGPVDAHHEQARFTWHLGPRGGRADRDRVRRRGPERGRPDPQRLRLPGQGAGGLRCCRGPLRGAAARDRLSWARGRSGAGSR